MHRRDDKCVQNFGGKNVNESDYPEDQGIDEKMKDMRFSWPGSSIRGLLCSDAV
jgi:hypothetical protein